MMFLILAVALFVPSALGCCGPDKYAGHYYGIKTGDGYSVVVDNKRGMYYMEPLKKTLFSYILVDYKNKKLYMRFPDGKCNAFEPKEPVKTYGNCIPSDAVKIGDSFLGLNNALPVQAFKFKIEGKELTVVVTKKDCAPVFSVTHGFIKDKVLVTTGLTDNPSAELLSKLDVDLGGCSDA